MITSAVDSLERLVSKMACRVSGWTLTHYSAKTISATTNNMKLVHWPLMVTTGRRGLGGATALPGPSSLYQM